MDKCEGLPHERIHFMELLSLRYLGVNEDDNKIVGTPSADAMTTFTSCQPGPMQTGVAMETDPSRIAQRNDGVEVIDLGFVATDAKETNLVIKYNNPAPSLPQYSVPAPSIPLAAQLAVHPQGHSYSGQGGEESAMEGDWDVTQQPDDGVGENILHDHAYVKKILNISEMDMNKDADLLRSLNQTLKMLEQSPLPQPVEVDEGSAELNRIQQPVSEDVGQVAPCTKSKLPPDLADLKLSPFDSGNTNVLDNWTTNTERVEHEFDRLNKKKMKDNNCAHRSELINISGKDGLCRLFPLLIRRLMYEDKDPHCKGIYKEKPPDWPGDLAFGDPNNAPPGGNKPDIQTLRKMCCQAFSMIQEDQDMGEYLTPDENCGYTPDYSSINHACL